MSCRAVQSDGKKFTFPWLPKLIYDAHEDLLTEKFPSMVALQVLSALLVPFAHTHITSPSELSQLAVGSREVSAGLDKDKMA